MDKGEFYKKILDLSIKKGVSDTLKTKAIDLIAKDSAVDFTLLNKRVEAIENSLKNKEVEKFDINNFGKSDELTVNKSMLNNSNIDLPEYIDPRIITDFLHGYNQDKYLRSTCHEVDEDMLEEYKKDNGGQYSFDFHLEKILQSYQSLFHRTRNKFENDEQKKQFINHYLKVKIETYLKGYQIVGSKGWSKANIKQSWSDEELKKWAKLSIYPPNYFDEEKCFKWDSPIEVNGKKIFNFKVLANEVFKNATHFKLENPLHKGINRVNRKFKNKKNTVRFDDKFKKGYEDLNLNFDFVKKGENIGFLTDTEKFLEAYSDVLATICETIITSNNNNTSKQELLNEFENNLMEDGNKIIFTLKHKNFKYQKSLGDFYRYGTRFKNIIKKINGLCDWQIEADFDEDISYKLNIWPRKKNREKIDKVNGVKFIFTFYRVDS